MDTQLKKALANNLNWFPELGYGFLNVKNQKKIYFDEYASKAQSPIGEALTKYRVNLVNRFTKKEVVDIGIGCGDFISHRTYPMAGFDIDLKSIEWLKKRDLFIDIYEARVLQNLTFWDSLEHIESPDLILNKVTKDSYVFISMPIYINCEHVLYSKHYKTNEHCWYFTWAGLIKYMEGYSFKYVDSSDGEIKLGREGVASFVFQKGI